MAGGCAAGSHRKTSPVKACYRAGILLGLGKKYNSQRSTPPPPPFSLLLTSNAPTEPEKSARSYAFNHSATTPSFAKDSWQRRIINGLFANDIFISDNSGTDPRLHHGGPSTHPEVLRALPLLSQVLKIRYLREH
ncbi:hypothetical protein KSP39_PZI007489 [Platanthera zijinensis]|uniref:Uncharacterized protein n=1 Tax=Platanthera zijinensis TaxID=2320716 RepID=A0AAP0GA95_9ASPA